MNKLTLVLLPIVLLATDALAASKPLRISSIGLSSTFMQEHVCILWPIGSGNDLTAFGEIDRSAGTFRFSINGKERLGPIDLRSAPLPRTVSSKPYAVKLSAFSMNNVSGVQTLTMTVTSSTGSATKRLTVECFN